MSKFSGFAALLGAGFFLLGIAQADPFAAQNDYARASAAGVLPTVISAGVPDPQGRVPVINGIKGSGVNNISLSFPVAVLGHGGIYNISMATQNTNFKGSCKTTYKIVQGGKTLMSGTIKKSFSCKPGEYFLWLVNTGRIPNKPGAATLVGTVTFGGKTASISVPIDIV